MANNENLKPFKKGVDERRQLKGAPRKIPNLDIAIAEILGELKDDKTALDMILVALKNKAKMGDIRAAELLLDRAYGKAKQSIEVSEKVYEIVKRN
jgi:hypothetical protein